MIPLCVRLKGFLCYKDEQEISFDGSSLWMLSGLNGSGKSAVFDAVTFAMFGHHRGGSSQAQELVNKNTDGFEIEFEFLQDNQAYRLRRTLKKKTKGSPSSTQQIFKRVSHNGTGQGKWEALEDTSKRAGFDEWINHNIGLNYETFTSSVLLLQGKAERLLESGPKGRFEVLAGIVNLDRYQRLYERADAEKKRQAGEFDTLQNRLKVLPEISPMELLEAEGRVQATATDREKSGQEVERLQGIEFQARQWQELHGKLEQRRQRLRQTESLLADAAEIERDEMRLKELQAVLPTVKGSLEQRHGREEAERNVAKLEEQKQHIEKDLAGKEEELARTRLKRGNLETDQVRDEQKLQDLGGRLREAAAVLQRLKECERQEETLAQVQRDLKQLGENPAAQVQQVRDRFDQLTELAQSVPKLTRFAELRTQLGQAVQQGQTASAARLQIETQGKKLNAQLDETKSQLSRATQAREAAASRATETATLLGEAQKQLDELLELHGAKICRHCGQELTPAHVEQEKIRRQGVLDQAKRDHQQAVQNQRQAQHDEQNLQKSSLDVEQQRNHARDEYRDHHHHVEQARKDVQRLQEECQRLRGELPSAFAAKISADAAANWPQTTYPASADLKELAQKALGLDAARKQLRDAEYLLSNWNQGRGQEASLQQSLARLRGELPQDRPSVRRQHTDLEVEEKSLAATITARRGSLQQTQRDFDDLARHRDRIQQELNKCRGDLQTQAAMQENYRQLLARYLKELPMAWQQTAAVAGLSQLNDWFNERDQLVARQTEQRAQQLVQARLTVEGMQRETCELEHQLAQFPPEACQGPQAIQQLLLTARNLHKQRDENLQLARQQFDRLESQHSQRRQLEQEILAADAKRNYWGLLAKLLGRDCLQRDLVRKAERQVVDHANAMLDRLSGGELYLKLCGVADGEGNSAKALEMEAHNRVTGEKPINVAFLSGSQKFRVAVSLALGIGQYASHQHRPIESVIIDEGFGCLDRNARQVMIQELQNLRSQMRCILLVSHQEEFADAFADGYHFELQNGTTVARRFQR